MPHHTKANLFYMITSKIVKILGLVRLLAHKSRQDCMAGIIQGMIESCSVQFHQIAYKLNPGAKHSSNVRRIERFFQEQELDYDRLALLLAFFLPPGPVKLCMDRTNWCFGKKRFNVLMITACCQGVGLPLYFEMLDNQGGNSQTSDREKLLISCLWLLEGRIACLLGDREFIGYSWIKYLLRHKIPFVLRIRENQYMGQRGYRLTARERLGNRKKALLDGAQVMGHYLGVSIQATTKSNELLVLVTSLLASRASKLYKERWTIEVFFQSLKTRGFNLEESCLMCEYKMKKMVALLSLAFAICLSVGLEAAMQQAIKVKNHGYKANSFFRHGLQIMRYAIKNYTEKAGSEALAWLDWIYSSFMMPKIIHSQ